jgi:transcriptional regulator with XRE-family HTH domain
MSKAELARAARLDQGLVSKIESGRVRPYMPELRRLAQALDWPEDRAEELLTEVSNVGRP